MIANTELAFSENEEVEFVWAVCQQVRNDPSLIDLFIQVRNLLPKYSLKLNLRVILI